MSGGALGRASGSALNRGPTQGSVMASTFLLAGSQALGILLEPTGVKRATFNDFSVSPGEASDTVSYIAGTVETVPHLISYFDFHSKKVKNDVQISQMLINAGLDGLAGYVAGGGTFGLAPDPPTAFIGLAEGAVLGAIVAGLGQLRTASYRYYCGFLYGICHGVIDSIEAVKVDERIVSFGANAGDQFLIDDPSAWGGDHVDGGVYALCKAIPGNFWPTQSIDPYIASQLGANTSSWSGKALFLMYGFSGFTESGYFAATPSGAPAVRPLKLRVRRLPSNLGIPDFHDINGDANIAECCFEWLTSPTFGVKKLPLSKIDVASFQAGAETHFNRGLGISLEMNADTDVETALDKFTALGDSIIYGSFNSGTIRYKVIERDYSIASLPVFRRGPDGSSPELYNVIKVDGFTPGTWANTANDFTFDYIDRNNNYLKATRYVQDTANKMLTGRTRSLSQSLDGVSNGATAALVGTRELRAGSYPRPPISLSVNRDGYALEPGSVIKYVDSVDNFIKILRVAEVQALATDEKADVQLNCTEDQYGVGSAAFAAYAPPGFSLTLHLHFEVEDSLSALSDALAKFNVVFVGTSLSDAINLSDAIEIQLAVASLSFSGAISLTDTVAVSNIVSALSFSDSINNLADSVAAGTGAAFGNGPETISDLELWLDAYQIIGLNNGDEVPTWDDQSGNNRDATGILVNTVKPTYRATDGPNSQPCVRLVNNANSQGGYFTLPNFLTGFTAGHIFIIPKSDLAAGGDAFPVSDFGSDLSGDIYAFSDNRIFSAFGSNARKDCGNSYTGTFNITNWLALEIRAAAGAWEFRINGSTISGPVANTVAWGTAPFIGHRSAGSANERAQIAEIFMFSRVLNGTEYTTIKNYILAKYGITIA